MLYIASLIQFPLEGTAYSQGEKADPHWRFDCFTACLFLLFLMEPNHEYQHLHLVGQLASLLGLSLRERKNTSDKQPLFVSDRLCQVVVLN